MNGRARAERRLTGGSTGNGQLTAVVASLLLVLLAIEGATLLQVRALLTVHAFVGMLLIPVVSLKLASTGWRMVRYYRRSDEYVRLGPPPILLRAVVAPVLLLSTVVLFATGIALLVLGRTDGAVLGLHKASFIVWFGAAGVHVLAHVPKLPRLLRARVPGTGLRVALAAVAVVAGVSLAVATLPSADRLQDRASAHIDVDSD